MEEQVIKENFCKYCDSLKDNCLKIETIVKKDLKIYRCVNYKSITKKTKDEQN